jgi:hypothetical protein
MNMPFEFYLEIDNCSMVWELKVLGWGSSRRLEFDGFDEDWLVVDGRRELFFGGATLFIGDWFFWGKGSVYFSGVVFVRFKAYYVTLDGITELFNKN